MKQKLSFKLHRFHRPNDNLIACDESIFCPAISIAASVVVVVKESEISVTSYERSFDEYSIISIAPRPPSCSSLVINRFADIREYFTSVTRESSPSIVVKNLHEGTIVGELHAPRRDPAE